MKSYVPISADCLTFLRRLVFQSGATPHRLFADDELPEGLSCKIIDFWLSGRIGSARPEHLEYVRRAYSDFAQTHISSERFRFTLKSEIERTGLSPHKLLRRTTKSVPDDLSAADIRRWTTKQPIPAPKDHVDFVREAYADQPSASTIAERLKERSVRLCAERARTGVSFRGILKGGGIPGVTPGRLERLVAGGVKHKLSGDQINLVLALYETLPDDTTATAEEGRAALAGEADRTGWSAIRLFRVHGEPGDPANPGALDSFRRGRQDTVSRDDLERALELYGRVPDKVI